MNAPPCWRSVIPSNSPAFRPARSCRSGPIRGGIRPRNPASTTFCARPGQTTGPTQPTRQLQGQRALRGLDLGHHLDTGTRRGHGLLPLSDPLPGCGLRSTTMRGVDIFSRKIVGWEGHECESADLAATLIRQAVMAEGCIARPLVLHADNGSPLFLTFS